MPSSNRLPTAPPAVPAPAPPADALERVAKSIVALAFRNGPLEDLHAGKTCPTCDGMKAFSKISNPEMKQLMKKAVNSVYSLLKLKEDAPELFEGILYIADSYTRDWDPARFTMRI